LEKAALIDIENSVTGDYFYNKKWENHSEGSKNE
jgi:hypothetical protein